MEYRFGTISIFIRPEKDQIKKLNDILSQYSQMIQGRMGVPNMQQKINTICLIIHGTTDQIGSLTGKLGSLSDVQLKSCLYKEK